MALDRDDVASLPTMLFRSVEGEPSPDARLTDLKYLENSEFGAYELQNLLGRGGMGWVFLARHKRLGRLCALKILAPHLAAKDADYLERFYTEGEAAAALNHPHVVTVHSIGDHDGLHYLEMEFLSGRSLQSRLKSEQYSPFRAVALTLGIAQGLAAAHEHGVLHRDLKPDNVLLSHRGIPKLADFGLCKKLHVPCNGAPLAGTPHYMAPELFQGEPASPASDVYALGVCLFALLSGQLPYRGRNINELMQLVVHERLPEIRRLVPDVPLEVAEAVSLMLEKTPSNRPRDGVAAMQLLQAVLGQLDDMEALLRDALQHERHITWQRIGSRDEFQVEVTLPSGRRQTVHIVESMTDPSDRTVRLSSLCCPVVPAYFQSALRLNSQIQHGAICLAEHDGREYFEIINNYPRATIDAEELRRSILEISLHADEVERELTGQDHY